MTRDVPLAGENPIEPMENRTDVPQGRGGRFAGLPPGRRWVAIPGVLAVIVLGAVVVGFRPFTFVAPPSSAPPQDSPGSAAAFAYLAMQRGNSCGLQPETVMGYDDSMRLQGSCCNPMDIAKYEWQVSGLRRLAGIDAVPTDPYDIPVSLAKRLLDYERSITLDAAQQRTFDDAMRQTRDGAPCCCECWRWHTTTGLANYLIVEKGFGAAEVAEVVDLVNGCGGPLETDTADVDPGRA